MHPPDHGEPSEEQLSRQLIERDRIREGQRRRQSRWVSRAVAILLLVGAAVFWSFPSNRADVRGIVHALQQQAHTPAGPDEPAGPKTLKQHIDDVPFGKEFIQFIHPKNPELKEP